MTSAISFAIEHLEYLKKECKRLNGRCDEDYRQFRKRMYQFNTSTAFGRRDLVLRAMLDLEARAFLKCVTGHENPADIALDKFKKLKDYRDFADCKSLKKKTNKNA